MLGMPGCREIFGDAVGCRGCVQVGGLQEAHLWAQPSPL